ncbi:hypothetical protein FRC02_006397 [Tulasnella sp. 418]|nr:hypothetical protein FRC02_006397 [Tulasnella sp. 418]
MKLAIVALCVFLPSFLPAVFAGMKPSKLGPVDPAVPDLPDLPDPNDESYTQSRHFSLMAKEQSNLKKVHFLKIHKNQVVTSRASSRDQFAIVNGNALLGIPGAANQEGRKYACFPAKNGVKQGPLSFGTGSKVAPGWNEFGFGAESKILYRSSDTFYKCKEKVTCCISCS